MRRAKYKRESSHSQQKSYKDLKPILEEHIHSPLSSSVVVPNILKHSQQSFSNLGGRYIYRKSYNPGSNSNRKERRCIPRSAIKAFGGYRYPGGFEGEIRTAPSSNKITPDISRANSPNLPDDAVLDHLNVRAKLILHETKTKNRVTSTQPKKEKVKSGVLGQFQTFTGNRNISTTLYVPKKIVSSVSKIKSPKMTLGVNARSYNKFQIGRKSQPQTQPQGSKDIDKCNKSEDNSNNNTAVNLEDNSSMNMNNNSESLTNTVVRQIDSQLKEKTINFQNSASLSQKFLTFGGERIQEEGTIGISTNTDKDKGNIENIQNPPEIMGSETSSNASTNSFLDCLQRASEYFIKHSTNYYTTDQTTLLNSKKSERREESIESLASKIGLKGCMFPKEGYFTDYEEPNLYTQDNSGLEEFKCETNPLEGDEYQESELDVLGKGEEEEMYELQNLLLESSTMNESLYQEVATMSSALQEKEEKLKKASELYAQERREREHTAITLQHLLEIGNQQPVLDRTHFSACPHDGLHQSPISTFTGIQTPWPDHSYEGDLISEEAALNLAHIKRLENTILLKDLKIKMYKMELNKQGESTSSELQRTYTPQEEYGLDMSYRVKRGMHENNREEYRERDRRESEIISSSHIDIRPPGEPMYRERGTWGGERKEVSRASARRGHNSSLSSQMSTEPTLPRGNKLLLHNKHPITTHHQRNLTPNTMPNPLNTLYTLPVSSMESPSPQLGMDEEHGEFEGVGHMLNRQFKCKFMHK